MARTPAQRGHTGNFLVERRLARGWDTQTKARAEIERLTGWRIPQSVYAEWESGRRVPSDANLARLQAFYGPGDGLERPVAGTDALAAAIEAQTRAIHELVEVVREDRESQQRVLDAVLRVLLPPGGAASEELLALLGKAE